MKKVWALVLALVMAFTLCSCGNSADSDGKGADATEFEEMELIFTSIYDENSSSAATVQYFMDYVTEKTGGAVTWNVFWSQTMASAREELDMVSSGSADVAALNVLPYANQLVMAQWPRYTVTGLEGIAEYGNYLMFENEETAKLIQDNFEANNVHTVGFSSVGCEAYFSTKPVEKIEDMEGMLFGTGTAGALETAYGMNVVFCIGPDAYDSLQRGVVDVAGISITNASDYSLHEVAPYWVHYNRSGLNGMVSINLDKWNTFSPELQKVFEDAGKAVIEYAVDTVAKNEQEIMDNAKAQGVTIVMVDDVSEYGQNDFLLNAENALATAQTNGAVDGMKAIIAAGAEFLDYDAADLLAKY